VNSRPHYAVDSGAPATLNFYADDEEPHLQASSGPLTPVDMGYTYTSMENISVPNFQTHGTATPSSLHINHDEITGAAEFNQSIIHIAQELEGHHHDHDDGSMNMHGIFLHLVGDALGSLGVIVTALVTWLTDWKYKWIVDPSLR
jgi:hypothetical protein